MKVLHIKTLLTTMNPKKMMSNIATHYCFLYRGNTKKKTMTSSFSSSFFVTQCKVFLKIGCDGTHVRTRDGGGTIEFTLQ
jgi:hypothetical protein